jgi:hypothetical protein
MPRPPPPNHIQILIPNQWIKDPPATSPFMPMERMPSIPVILNRDAVEPLAGPSTIFVNFPYGPEVWPKVPNMSERMDIKEKRNERYAISGPFQIERQRKTINWRRWAARALAFLNTRVSFNASLHPRDSNEPSI